MLSGDFNASLDWEWEVHKEDPARWVHECRLLRDKAGKICPLDEMCTSLIWSWSWRPPNFVRQQGREAKEEHNSRNNHPEIYLTTLNGEELKLDACPCGGELVKDRCECLYCRDCGMVYNHHQ